MKLINTEIGRSVQLVLPDEVRPVVGMDLPALLQAVAARYGFAKHPAGVEGFATSTGLRFEHGRITIAGLSNTAPIHELSIFNDGVIAVCANTDLADALIDDIFAWAVGLGLLRQPASKRPRQYVSNVIVQFDKLSEGRAERIFRTASLFSAALSEEYGWEDRGSTLQRVSFSIDPNVLPPHRSAALLIERRTNVPYEQNYFFSSAPLRLAPHLALIEAFERELADLGTVCSDQR